MATCVALQPHLSPASRPVIYVAHALLNPATTVPTIGGVGLALYVGSPLLLVLALMLACTGTGLVSRAPRFRASVDACRRERERRRHRDDHAELIDAAAGDRATFDRLADLADELHRNAPGPAERLEVDALLARWVRLELARTRAVRVVCATGRGELVAALDRAAAIADHDEGLQHRIIAHRLALWDAARAQTERVATDLRTIAELMHLAAQHVTWCAERAEGDALDDAELVPGALAHIVELDRAWASLARRRTVDESPGAPRTTA